MQSKTNKFESIEAEGLFSSHGYRKVHVSELYYPMDILIPEFMDQNANIKDYTIYKLANKDNLARLYTHNIEYAWVLKTDIMPKNQSNDLDFSEITEPIATKIKIVEHKPLSVELEKNKTFFKKSHKQVQVALDSLRKNGVLPMEEIKEVVHNITTAVAQNPSTLLCLRSLQSADEYTYFHSINVSLYASVFAKFLGYKAQEVWEISYAGILHDIGKQRIPLSVLNAPRKLSEDEFKLMQLHPALAHDMLKNENDLTDSLMHAVSCHHEKFDGSGYPYGIKGSEIHPHATIVALADIYDALTSERPYKQAFTQNKTASIIYSQRGISFSTEMTDKFICCFGVYPIGTLVRLNNNEFAIVYENNVSDLLHPKVIQLSRKFGKLIPCGTKSIDLRHTKGSIEIVSCEDSKAHHFNLQEVFLSFSKDLLL